MSRTIYKYKYEDHIAGPSDVFKHIVLCTCIQELQKSHPEGILVVDTHCGDGAYDLQEIFTSRGSTQYRKGILKVLAKYEEAIKSNKLSSIPKPVVDFIQLLLKSTGCTGSSDLDVYPGSPVYTQNLLRPKVDEHRLLDYYLDYVEWLKDPSTFEQLNANDPATMEYIMPSHSSSAGAATKPTKHPVIFIDPSYDDDEYVVTGGDSYGGTKQLVTRILDANPNATVLICMPYISNHKFRFSFPKNMRELAKDKAKTGRYFCSMTVNPAELQGSCILVCNPTPTLDDVLNDDTVYWLANTMNQGKDEFLVEQVMKKKKSSN